MTEYTFEEAKAMRETNAFDPRNIRDALKSLTNEEVRQHLKNNSSHFVLCLSNNIRDMNLSSAIRSANAFNINKTIMVGRRNYDRRGACGVQNYSTIEFEKDWRKVFDEYRRHGYKIVALEYNEHFTMHNIRDYEWQPKTLMICGEEGLTIPDEILKEVDDIVYIPMRGSVRSFNLASAVSIALYDYTGKVKK